MAAVVGEDGRDGLQDFSSVSPSHHQTEEAGAGQSRDGLSGRVVWPCAPDRGLQQQLEKRLWGKRASGEQVSEKRQMGALCVNKYSPKQHSNKLFLTIKCNILKA